MLKLSSLKEQLKILDANQLAEQIRRIEASVESDPSLAIGTAKELIETCWQVMILAERGKPVTGTPDISTLTKETFKALEACSQDVPDAARGVDVIKRLLSNLGTIGNGLAESALPSWNWPRQAWKFHRPAHVARKVSRRRSFDACRLPI